MNEQSVILFPFDKVKQNSRIILYGAGDVGQAFYWQVQSTNYCVVAGWIDQLWAEEMNLEQPKINLQGLKKISYDLIVIAMTNEIAAADIRNRLTEMGIPEEKVLAGADYVLKYPVYNYAAMIHSSTRIEDSRISKGSVKKLRMGFLAAGAMAHTMAETVGKRFPDVELYAVASRDKTNAKQFADKFGFRKAYYDYKLLVQDPQIDIIYISSPVSCHYEHTMMALKNKKHVLCEKPFTVNEQQAKEIIKYAEQEGLFVSDGLWTVFLPLVEDIKQILQEGSIGKISSLTANQHYPGYETERLVSYELCGGALLEMGVYLITFAVLLMGKDIKRIMALGKLTGQGVDSQESIIMEYEDALVTLNCGMNAVSDRRGYIYGDKGYIIIEDANEFKNLSVYNTKGVIVKEVKRQSGYQYEIQACLDAIRNNKIETEQRKHEDILFAMKLLDRIRKEINLVYQPD